ncbi:MAG: hypothetical protein PF517_22175 [Salinivirgaceae bacterium]|jgi:ribonuclease HI|nr:hypothetical protein [Salinivirgaceae bacterium]
MNNTLSNNISLFTDGSVNPQLKVGFGAILIIDDITQPIDELKKKVQTKQFVNTSSTKLELQTMLWALNDVELADRLITIYTDSQNLVGLLERRVRLEAKNYRSKKNDQIENAKLYKAFFQLYDQLHFNVIKVKGHKQTKTKGTIDNIFTLVDRASRDALRNHADFP